ncbi:MAG: chitinase [Porticoccaceae bacterium]
MLESTVDAIEIFANGNSIATGASVPFSFSWLAPPKGSDTLTAVAVEAGNISRSSVAINVSVSGLNNSGPTVALTAPLDGATTPFGDSVIFNATASDTDGTVAKVEFYAGATKLWKDTSAPYSYTWSNPTSGFWSLTAIAVDDDNAFTTLFFLLRKAYR